MKDIVPKKEDGTTSNFWTLFCGGSAGAFGQTIAYPLDLVRRRLQLQGWKEQGGIVIDSYDGMTDAFRKIYQKQGIRGFYKGLLPNCKRAVSKISTFLD